MMVCPKNAHGNANGNGIIRTVSEIPEIKKKRSGLDRLKVLNKYIVNVYKKLRLPDFSITFPFASHYRHIGLLTGTSSAEYCI